MIQDWLLEIAKGIGKLFLNPLLYWAVLFVILVGIRRIKRERNYFSTKVFDIFSEWKDTWVFSILIGIFYSIVIILAGMVVTYEFIIILSIVTIILSLTFRFTLLSPSYTIGITILIIVLSPLFKDVVPISGEMNIEVLAILLALLLFVEAHYLSRIRQNETFPELILGARGSWIGRHLVKRISIIPLFLLVPSGQIEPFAAYWPYFSIGDETYALILIPFVLGFEFSVRGSLPHEAAHQIALKLLLLAVIILGIAIGSIWFTWLVIVAVVLAIFGKEFIHYRFRINDQNKVPFFNHTNEGLKVLSVIPGSPAERLNIVIGETVTKVNGKKIQSEAELYEALQQTGSFFKLELIDNHGEVRFVQSALYEGEHHGLGLIFTREPFRKIK